MGIFVALLSSLGFTWRALFVRLGLMQKNSGSAANAQFFIIGIHFLVILLFVTLLQLFGFDVLGDFRQLTFAAAALFVLDGILGPVGAAVLINSAIGQIGASRTSAIRASNPLFTTILAIILLGETPGWTGVFAVVVLISGIILVSLSGTQENIAVQPKTKLAGNVIALLGALSFSFAQIMQGAALERGGTPITGVIISGFVALIILTSIYRISLGSFNFIGSVDHRSLRFYVAAGVADFVGRFSLFFAYTLIPVWLAVAIRNTQPLLALVFSWMFLRKTEKINLQLAVGSLLAMSGAILAIMA